MTETVNPPGRGVETPWAELGIEDFERLFGCDPGSMPDVCARIIQSKDFGYRVLEGADRDRVLVRVLTALDEDMERAGSHRHDRWEVGWGENLEAFADSGFDVSKLVPMYNRGGVIRLEGQYVQPRDADFETNFVSVFRMWLFATCFRDVNEVYEFGCGSGYTIAAMAKLFPDKRFHGLDWAASSMEILSLLSGELGLDVTAHRFDMLAPDQSIRLSQGGAVYTAGALEQLGREFEPFLAFLLDRRPSICVHAEPLYELYDDEKLLDYLAARYTLKRNYLNGFVDRLRELEADGRVEILKLQRTLGSLFHDGYSIVIWKPTE